MTDHDEPKTEKSRSAKASAAAATSVRSGDASTVAVSSSASVGLMTLVNIRWMAVGGQFATLVTVYFGFGFEFPIAWALGAVGMSVVLNIFLVRVKRPGVQLSDRHAAAQLAYDLAQLAALLYLTGGISNPFAILMLAPVAISATFLSRRATVALLTLGLVSSLALVLFHMPLPWDETPLKLADRYNWGLWGGLAVAMVFLALYAARISEEARRRNDALTATQAALSREKHMAALGALAAAAAHELGTPLGSIMLTARELEREHGSDGPLGEDLSLIAEQAHRCREILKTLSTSPEEHRSEPFTQFNIEALIREAARPFAGAHTEIIVQSKSLDEARAPAPSADCQAEILHGLGNFIENAAEFASEKVVIDISWTAHELVVEINDDGQGFNAAVLSRLGQPYLSSRSNQAPGDDDCGAGGLGLGIFIAKTLIERTGGHVTFANRKSGGAVVCVRWKRADIENSAATKAGGDN